MSSSSAVYPGNWFRRSTSPEGYVDVSLDGMAQPQAQDYRSMYNFLDSDENFMIYRRFGFLQTRLLLQKQDDLRRLEEQPDQLDAQDRQDQTQLNRVSSIGLAFRGEQQNRRLILDLIEQRLSEYDAFLLRAGDFVKTNLRTGANQCVRDWLCERTNLPRLEQESDLRWRHYCKKVRSMILDSETNSWLEYNMSDLIVACEHDGGMESISRMSALANRFRRGWRRLGFNHRQATEGGLAEDTVGNNISQSRRDFSEAALQILRRLGSTIFLPASFLVYSINLGSAVAFLMLVNPPPVQSGPPSDVYWKICLAAWVITIAILLIYGMFFGGPLRPTEWYAPRIILVNIVLCSTITYALHLLNANIASGALVGVSLSVVFIHILA